MWWAAVFVKKGGRPSKTVGAQIAVLNQQTFGLC